MKWYHHHNPSVITSVDGDSLVYYEVRDGQVLQSKELLRYYHQDWIEGGQWRPITKREAYNIISSILGERYPKGPDLSKYFTTIDVHMFSVNL